MRFAIRSVLVSLFFLTGFPLESNLSAATEPNSFYGVAPFLPSICEADFPLFSTESDLMLGQRRRQRGGGGRVWTNLYYGDTVLEPKKYDFEIKPDLYGVQLGFDVVQQHGMYATFFGNYNHSSTKVGDVGKSTIDNYLFGFGKYISLQACHFGFTASVGYDDYKFRDHATALTGRGDGMQLNLSGEFGIDLIFDRWEIKPFYNLQYDFLYHGRIGSREFTVQGDWNDHSLVQTFGLRLKWKPSDMLTVQTRSGWVHEMLKHPPPFYNIRFSAVQGTTTPAVFFYEGHTGRDWAWVGLGTKFQLAYNVFLFLDYDLMINEYHATHFGCLGLCLGW